MADRLPIVEVDDVTPRLASLLRRDPTVIGFGMNSATKLIAPVEVATTPSGEGEAAWGIQVVGAHDSVWTGIGTTVGLLDTGIDTGHPWFAQTALEVKDFTGEGPGDSNGHGTHCAGVLFGHLLGHRVGMAPGVNNALVGKVLDAKGAGTAETLFQGVLWAAERGAGILSLSLGFDFPAIVRDLEATGVSAQAAASAAISGYVQLLRAFDRLTDMLALGMPGRAPMLIFAASGNESSRHVNPRDSVGASPLAAAEKVIAVGAVGRSGDEALRVAPFSNHGVDLCAPGVDIIGPRAGGETVQMSGTSMATPYAAGAAALWAEYLGSERSKVSLDELKSRIVGSCKILPGVPTDRLADSGAGLVRVPE
jgi:subtilisin family serine protease